LLCNNKDKLLQMKDELSWNFEMKDLGDLHFFLGMEMERDHAQHLFYINQIGYFKEILKCFCMEDSKLSECHMIPRQSWRRMWTSVATLTLGSWPKQGLAKVRAKCEGRESHFMFPRVWESVREWTPTLPSELPLWELESQRTLESSKNDFKGQSPLDQKVSYIIENILEHKCLKWARMTHLDTFNISYGQKKGRESNCQFDFWPLKVRNCLDFLACRWIFTYLWKVFDEGNNVASDLISIKGLHTKLCAPKVARVWILGISGLPFGNPRTKWHLSANLVARHIVYYKREGGGGGFLWVWAMVSLVNPGLPMVCLCTKNTQITN
jgi:hypothetical protein